MVALVCRNNKSTRYAAPLQSLKHQFQLYLDAIEHIADHCELYSFSCSKTRRTARSLTSGEYRFDLLMLQSSQELEPPVNSARFNPLSLRQVEDLLFERGVDICHETVRFWWNRFAPMFAGEIRKRRVHNQLHSNWRWHFDEGVPRRHEGVLM